MHKRRLAIASSRFMLMVKECRATVGSRLKFARDPILFVMLNGNLIRTIPIPCVRTFPMARGLSALPKGVVRPTCQRPGGQMWTSHLHH